VLGSNDKSAVAPQFRRPAPLLERISAMRSALTALWFGRNHKMRRISTDFFTRDDPPQLSATVRRKKSVMKLRLNIKCLSMWLSPRFGPVIRDTADVNLAAFTSAFGFARHCGLGRGQSDNLSRSRQALSGIGIFSGQNEGTRCTSFFSHSPCCR
jgi:hypothetical protein